MHSRISLIYKPNIYNYLKYSITLCAFCFAPAIFADTQVDNTHQLSQNNAWIDVTAETEADDPRELRDIEVTTSLSSLAEGRPAKVIKVITQEEIAKQSVQTIPDVLKLASGIDVRQRGGYGVQTDINIDGGTHDQITILLNGVNISNPQVGHYSSDWPVNLEDIERIEVLEGAGSRILGGSTLMGAINIITKTSHQRELTVSAEAGSYGTVGGEASGRLPIGKTSHLLSAGAIRSDGGTVNSGFSRIKGFYQGQYDTERATVDWQFGTSELSHGANTFYSAAFPNQHDQLTRYLASVSANMRTWLRIEPMAYWLRTYDHYELVKGTDFGENHHRVDVLGGRVNLSKRWSLGNTSIGSEIRRERILSTALGTPMDSANWVNVPGKDDVWYKKEAKRTCINLYAEHNLHYGAFDLSLGLTASRNTGIDRKFRLYPGIDLTYTPAMGWRIFASWCKAYRMPTFTDLYYKSVVIEGNKDIKPEQMQSILFGATYRRGFGTAQLKLFYHKGHNMIDWVMYHADDIFHSTGFDLDNMGLHAMLQLDLKQIIGNKQPLQLLSIDYTGIHQNRHDKREIYKSNYALEYLKHKFVASLDLKFGNHWSANCAFRWAARNGSYIKYADNKPTGTLVSYKPYGVLDVKIEYQLPRWTLHVTANNLTNNHYYDFGNIPPPGLWLMAGAKFHM